MKLAVHGTKDGYRILYTTDDEFARIISRDIRKGASGDEQLGKTAYALAFVRNGCAYSKYVIVKDSLRSYATGTIAFSLFVGVDETMKAEDIFKLLNELYSSYEHEYIRNNYLNRGEKELIREDWSFVTDILSKYKTTPDTKRHENINSGTKDPAFIYYMDDYELLEYFDKPFQPEYTDYSQILFIQSNQQESLSPINVLKNSGISLKIDLKNELFYLNNFISIRELTLTGNNRQLSDKKNNNSIRAKDRIRIKYIKDNYKPIEVEGRLCDQASDIYKYLETKGSQIIIKYDALTSSLIPITKTIIFNVRDWKGNQVHDAIIICKSDTSQKNVENNNQITFKGEDLEKRWIISANNDRLLSKEESINFERDCPADIGNIDIILNKHILNLTVHEEKIDGELIKNVRINKEIFIGIELEKYHKILVESRDHKSFSFDYHPLESNINKHIFLEKKQFVKHPDPLHLYDVSAGEHGTLKGGFSYSTYEKNGDDVKDKIIPNKGYKFIRFAEKSGTLVAQYKEVEELFYTTPTFIASTIVGFIIIFISIGIWIVDNEKKEVLSDQPQQKDYQNIQTYIEGNLLILDTLNNYKSILGRENNDLLGKLDNAIKKREFINTWNFDSLKRLHYYPAQQKFENAIKKIKNSQHDSVKSRLNDVSVLNLDQIADSINAILHLHKQTTENKAERNDDDQVEKKVVKEDNKVIVKKEETQPAKTEQKKDGKLVSQSEMTTIGKDIIKKLQSDAVTKDELENWKNGEMDKYKTSINLYLEFWASIKQGMILDESKQLLNKIKADKYLKYSALHDFLKSVCASNESFINYNNTPGKKTCKTINELRSKLQ